MVIEWRFDDWGVLRSNNMEAIMEETPRQAKS